MKTVWLVYPYGAIPGESFLEARYIRFGRILARNNYQVVWWTANFSHTFKQKRSNGWKTIEVCKNFVIKLVPTSEYDKNISIKRIAFEKNYAKALEKAFRKTKKPNLIITAGTGLATAFRPVWPYMKENSVPVIYDIMDVHMFDSYIKTHKKALYPAAKVINAIYNLREKEFYRNVAAVSALGKNQLEIAIKRTGRSNIPSCLVYNGISVSSFRERMEQPSSIQLPEKEKGWHWCVYAGSLGPSYDIDSVVKCAKRVINKGLKIRFLIAGAGPQEDMVKREAQENNCITYLGSLDPKDLPAIYGQCDVGLCTYADYSTVDMPDKFYDYCAAGLAIVNSLQGEIKSHIEEKQLGVQYTAGSDESLFESIQTVLKGQVDIFKKNAYSFAQVFDFDNQMIPFLEMIEDIV